MQLKIKVTDWGYEDKDIVWDLIASGVAKLGGKIVTNTKQSIGSLMWAIEQIEDVSFSDDKSHIQTVNDYNQS